jgi:hypothetical protein
MSDHFRLWVDAICINQNNLFEKNAQVQIMSRIFSQADSVFAGLGYTTRFDTKNTFRFIKEASFHGQLSFPKSDDNIRHWSEKFVYGDASKSHMYHGPLLVAWRNVVELLKLSYWSRRWIVQEIFLAREATLVLDKEELSWTAFELLFGLLDQRPVEGDHEDGGQFLWQLMGTIHWKLWLHRAKQTGPTGDRLTSLSLLLKDFGPTICTVTRDRVYAPISTTADRDSIHVDYTCSMIEAFSRILSPGKIGLLNFTDLLNLAAELGLPEEPKEKQGDSGPFVKYSGKVTSLVRIIDVDLDWNRAFDFIDFIEDSSLNLSCVRALRDIMKSHQKLTYKIKFATSRALGQNISLKKKTKHPMQGCRGEDSTLPRGWTYFVCDEGRIGWGCSSIRPGDFICPMGQLTSLVLRYQRGVFKIVGAACTPNSLPHPRAGIDLSDIEKKIPNEAKVPHNSDREEFMMVLEGYNTLMMDSQEGRFDYRWVRKRNLTAKPVHGLIGPTSVCNPKVELGSGIEIIFNTWELIAFAEQFIRLEQIGVGLEEKGPPR